jgi:DNA invertase Pin-like site-specific DNA recombinase
MKVILYARVSTSKQAENELSIPAQLRLSERYAKEHSWTVAGKYQDIGSGREFRNRSGLMAALGQAKQDQSIGGLIVHKIDRLSRSVFNYLVLKGKLQADNVRVYSVVEGFEASPMGEFIEHIMAAQAEYYSANLAAEVRKGIEERLLRGQWSSYPPVGYHIRDRRIVPDPARATRIREAFELWSAGNISTERLADEMYNRGLVSRNGKMIKANAFSRILKNSFYAGIMTVRGKEYPGIHPPLISLNLLERSREVFRQKVRGRHARKHLVFVLSHKLRCPRCASTLIGEHHVKKSGKVFDYYRCHEKTCRYVTRAKELDEAVCRSLLAMDLPGRFGPALRKRLRKSKQARAQEQGERVRKLRQRRRELDERLQSLARLYLERNLDESFYDREREMIAREVRATEWLLAKPANQPQLDDEDRNMYALLSTMSQDLQSNDIIAKRKVVEALVEKVEPGTFPVVHLRESVKDQLR